MEEKQKNNTTVTTISKESVNKNIIILIVAVIIIALIVFVMISSNKTTINLNDYIEPNVSVSGYDGAAQAYASFDSTSVVNDYLDKIKVSKKAISNNDVYNFDLDASKEITFEYMLEYYISGEFNKTENLSNGDTITYKWEITDSDKKEFEKMFNCKLKYKDFTYTVSGLEEVATINPFDENDFSIVYDGTAPYGSVTVNNSNHPEISYTVNPTSNLSNGDKIVVEATKNDNDESFVLSETSKEYTVEGLTEYVSDVAQIPSDYLDQMKEQAENVIENNENDWEEEKGTLKSSEYIGCYLVVLKPSTSSYLNDENKLFLVYKNDVTRTDGDFSFYTYIEFSEILKYSDGSCYTDLNDCSYSSGFSYFGEIYNTAFKHGNETYNGFESLEKLYNQEIVSLKDSYTIQENIEN